MLNFIKRIFSGEKRENQELPSKRATREQQIQHLDKKENQVKPINDDYIINDLINQLAYVHKDSETKVKKRLEAYQKLAKLGTKAEKSIPALIRKLFSNDRKEKSAAKDTLDKINKQWLESRYALEEISFLIKKLQKDQTIANRAASLLLGIGNEAIDRLVELLKDNDDPYLEYNILKIINKHNDENYIKEVFPILADRLKNTQNTQLLEIVTDILLCNEELVDGETIVLIVEVLNTSKSPDLKEKLIEVIANHKESTELTILPLFDCLADDNSGVRNKSIEALSKNNSPLLDELCTKVLEGKGEIKEDELGKVLEKAEFWINNDLKLYRRTRELFNNISWYNLELKKDLEKPMILLNSVLEICKTKKSDSNDLYPLIVRICKESANVDAKSTAINILSNYKEQKDEIIPIIIDYLKHDSKKVRKASIDCLFSLDKEWIRNQDNQVKINEIIDGFVGAESGSSMDVMVEVGDDMIPILIAKLEKAESRIIQESIIKVLDNFGDNVVMNIPALLKLKDKFKNAHTVKALKELIEKLEKQN